MKTMIEIKDKRLSICNGCERLFAPTKTCKECGCFMELKARVPFAHCPLNKWDAEYPEKN